MLKYKSQKIEENSTCELSQKIIKVNGLAKYNHLTSSSDHFGVI